MLKIEFIKMMDSCIALSHDMLGEKCKPLEPGPEKVRPTGNFSPPINATKTTIIRFILKTLYS